jgi:hypothetical protein
VSYNFRITSFTDGVTTFDATAAGVESKDGDARGPEAMTRIAFNDAGAIVDLDGTGNGAVRPPVVEHNFIFTADHPDGHAQYKNLLKLINHHGTLSVRIPNASSSTVKTVAARLISVEGRWQPPHKAATRSWLPITAKWQLKGLISVS